MSMLRFFAAAMIAALVVLAADRYAGGLFFAFGSLVAANFAYKVFTWVCMSVAALAVTPTPWRWPNVLICGLALSVGFYQSRELTVFTVASGQSTVFGWVVGLVVFALPLWLIWLWYKAITATAASSTPSI